MKNSNNSIVVKHICPPETLEHPRGWNSNVGHQRKLKSYQVELAWYKRYSSQLNESCKVPSLISSETIKAEHLIILEDLKSAGFSIINPQLDINGVKLVLKWLATFHANFINHPTDQLWETGTYWHLKTREEEWSKMNNSPLKKNALAIDTILSQSKYQTLIHGDAKLANFCFSKNIEKVAAVDFQYIGAGCGMKDVAYFLGSCMSSEDCEQNEGELLDYYFDQLSIEATSKMPKSSLQELLIEWRYLYPFAWADFQRFLEGWAPSHCKLNNYSNQQVSIALNCLKS